MVVMIVVGDDEHRCRGPLMMMMMTTFPAVPLVMMIMITECGY